MAMREQDRRSPPPETTRTASDEPPLPRLGLVTEGSVTTGDMAGGGAGEEEQGLEGSPNNIRSSSPRVALLSIVGGLKPCGSHIFACPEFQRKPRSHVPRAAPSHPWGSKYGPILPPALELEQPPPQQIQDPESPPDSPIQESMIDVDMYLLRRTSPRWEKSPPPPPPSPPPPPPPTTTTTTMAVAESAPSAAASPGNEKDSSEKWCLHCGISSTLQWRTGPAGEGTLCNACGVRYRQGRLVPEYRPRASPMFNQSEHSYLHCKVLKIREKQDHPAPPAAYQRIRRKRRKGKGQQQPAQHCKKRKGSKAQNQPAQAQPAPAATQQRAGNDMLQNLSPHPLPPQALPHADDDMETEQRLQFLPPVLAHADDEMEQHIPPTSTELPRDADDTDTMAQDLPPPPAQPHAGGELMMDDEPLPPPDPFLFDGPAAPRIIDDEPVVVIVIDDD